MNTITRSALVRFSASQMFDLVNDVNAYAEFLPWCKASQILQQDAEGIRARLTIALGAIHHSFTTLNRPEPGKRICIELVDGPFRHLEGKWEFTPIGADQGCRVSLELDFEFSTRLLDLALSPIFSQVTGSLVQAFCQRATTIYD